MSWTDLQWRRDKTCPHVPSLQSMLLLWILIKAIKSKPSKEELAKLTEYKRMKTAPDRRHKFVCRYLFFKEKSHLFAIVGKTTKLPTILEHL